MYAIKFKRTDKGPFIIAGILGRPTVSPNKSEMNKQAKFLKSSGIKRVQVVKLIKGRTYKILHINKPKGYIESKY